MNPGNNIKGNQKRILKDGKKEVNLCGIPTGGTTQQQDIHLREEGKIKQGRELDSPEGSWACDYELAGNETDEWDSVIRPRT